MLGNHEYHLQAQTGNAEINGLKAVVNVTRIAIGELSKPMPKPKRNDYSKFFLALILSQKSVSPLQTASVFTLNGRMKSDVCSLLVS